MSAAPHPLPLLPGFEARRPLFVAGTRQAPAPISHHDFLARAIALHDRLPRAPYLINLCNDRLAFALAFAAGLLRGAINLFPPNRLAPTITEIAADYPDAICVTDDPVAGLDLPLFQVSTEPGTPNPILPSMPMISPGQQSFVAFTSGSTGAPCPHAKYWGDLVNCAHAAARRFGFGPRLGIVATVPPQHMYGLELSILVPFVTGARVARAQPFFPVDIRAALELMPAPRVLVTTPAHLRGCLDADMSWCEIELVISATAPLSIELAHRVEAAWSTEVREIYGSTETGSIASRATCRDPLWHWYDGVRAEGDGDAVSVQGDFIHGRVPLADVLERTAPDGFHLLGRAADMVKVGGKRVSLTELNLKLNAVEGVVDGVFLPPDEDAGENARLAAAVVAPGLDRRAIVAGLAGRIDPVFYPRQVIMVERLPRNETGKLTQAALKALTRPRRPSR